MTLPQVAHFQRAVLEVSDHERQLVASDMAPTALQAQPMGRICFQGLRPGSTGEN